jgi:hypothetical protein
MIRLEPSSSDQYVQNVEAVQHTVLLSNLHIASLQFGHDFINSVQNALAVMSTSFLCFLSRDSLVRMQKRAVVHDARDALNELARELPLHDNEVKP